MATPITSIRMDDLSEAFLSEIKKDGTRKAYRRVLTRLQAFVSSTYQPIPSFETLQKAHLRAFLNETCQQDSPTSWNNHLSALRSFYRYLFEEEIIDVNPAIRIKREEVTSDPKIPMSFEEIWLLFKVFGCLKEPFRQRNQALLMMGFHTGLRVSEMSGVECSQIDLVNDVIAFVKVKGKGEQRQHVDLTPTAKLHLQAWLYVRDQFANADRPTDALFLGQWGRPLSVRQIHSIFATAGKSVGIERRVHPHLLRHSFVTEVSKDEKRLSVVQRVARHKSIKSTQRYDYVRREECKAASLALDARWQTFTKGKTDR